MVNLVKDQAVSFIGIAIAILAFGLLAPEGSRNALIITSAMFGLGFVVLILSLRFKPTWLTKTAQQLSTIRVSYITIFLALIGLALVILQNQSVVFGIIVILVAYLILSVISGASFGTASIHIYYRFRYKEWSVKQAAQLMGISQGRVRSLLAKGRIMGTKENNTWIVLKLGYERRNPGRRKNTIHKDMID